MSYTVRVETDLEEWTIAGPFQPGSLEQKRTVREKDLVAKNTLHPIRRRVSVKVLSSLGNNWAILRKLANLSNPLFPHCE